MIPVNLTLSGGGARGIAHLGAIKAMLEYGIEIKAIAGVSAGAIAGAFYCKGYSPDEILQIAIENTQVNFINPVRFSLGLMSKNKMLHVLEKYFPEDSFEKLKIPLYVYATNINLGEIRCFSSGQLVNALVASAALPILFPPVEIDGQQYLDGGLLNNLPVETFLRKKLPIIGVNVNPISRIEHLSSTLKIIERSMLLAIYKNIANRKRYCSLYIEPADLGNKSVFNFDNPRALFNIGYDSTRSLLDKSIGILENSGKSKQP